MMAAASLAAVVEEAMGKPDVVGVACVSWTVWGAVLVDEATVVW